jgi:aspartate aminotransferase-like enzyme
MTPGPTRVPERVLRAAGRAMIHHRTPEFSRELATAIELLGPVFGTTSKLLPIHTTGRGALEAIICNLLSSGDEIAVCCNGKFGEMWAAFAESYDVVVHRFAKRWDHDIDLNEIEQLFDDHPDIPAVALSYGDTSTGVANDVAAVARVVRARGAMVFVDGVSSIGGMPFAFDEWEIDAAVVASQKCLMSGPGLSFVAMSDRGWSASETSRLPCNYWNFADVRRSVSKEKPETPGTTPVQLVLQVAEALRLIHEEGLQNVIARHSTMAERTRAGAAELGLTLQCPALAHQSSTLTAISLPANIEPKPFRDRIKTRGILTAAGLGPYEKTGFRIGHMGDIRITDVEATLVAVREALDESLATAT